MKSILACVLLTACLAGVCAARDDKKKDAAKSHPDLSGTWTLDKSKSDFGPFSERPIAKADATLVISEHDPELKITRTLSLNGQQESKEFTYYADERGETNPASIGGGIDVKSKTKWEGDKLVSHAKVTRKGQRGDFDIDTTEKWQVSSDGKTLTQSIEISGPFGMQQLKLVFHRSA
ncbi:MAG: hypothetical protein QOC99_3107 [Acidobacteriota bacterium]|nr:hypothetical protein [Acidobacteriota bacterium]MDT7780595.1 hypothetical protein [Acidobacteriota bacterium]